MASKENKKRVSAPEDYNAKKAGSLWKYKDLPSHLGTLSKHPECFATAVRVFQKTTGLTADGKLGPKTLSKIFEIWPQLSSAKEPAKKEDPDANDKETD